MLEERSYPRGYYFRCWYVFCTSNCIGGRLIDVTAYSAFMDFVLAALPWPIIINLQMRTSEKIGISVGMSMGIW